MSSKKSPIYSKSVISRTIMLPMMVAYQDAKTDRWNNLPLETSEWIMSNMMISCFLKQQKLACI